ncbi:MAG: SDR family oxidoreductase [Spirochaetia bacterium]
MKESGNHIVITGGTSGIGHALAEAFCASGNEVLICGRRENRLEEARKMLPGLRTVACDLSLPEGRTTLHDHVARNFRDVNVLVNNAGIQRNIDFTKGPADLESGENEIRINLEAPIFLTSLFVPLLKGKEGAYVVNVSSGLGFVPMVATPVYCATKAAMHSFSMTLRVQLAPLGIKVLEVIPPGVESELNPQGRAGRPRGTLGLVDVHEYAASVVKGLRDDVVEIGYGYTQDMMKASRADLDKRFQMMNRISLI